MKYKSTRGFSEAVSAQQAILQGIAQDGGLFVPTEFPQLNLAKLLNKSYTEIAKEVLIEFLPDYDETFLKTILTETYGQKFDNKAGYLKNVKDDIYALELWHGPTSAFKDYALQLMPKLLLKAKEMLKKEEEIIILVATSGDTGKAALEGYKNLEGIQICVFYPENGTSEIQRLQMVTQEGNNVLVYAVKGNFDDTQQGVKIAFTNQELAKKLATENKRLSSANSINWGRLLPQIVYYVTSYLNLCKQGGINVGDEIDFCVPTGNFGDIMAGYYAKKMGVPIGKLICASNENNVLSDFFKTGKYNANRPFYRTNSPSMDILVSSNLERLLYHETKDAEKVSAYMNSLAQMGEYQIDATTLNNLNEIFSANWADEMQVTNTIHQLYNEYGYLADPHTAVAFAVANEYKRNGVPMIVLSTANPYKFSEKVLTSLGKPVPKEQDEFVTLHELEEYTGIKAPENLTNLSSLPILFTQTVDSKDVATIPFSL